MPESDLESYILFELGGTVCALNSRDVQHMELVEHVTPVPHASQFVEGVVFSRGQVVPAVNLRARFGLPRQEPTPASRLIIVQSGSRRVGLIVDSAREFRTIPAAAIIPPDQTAATGLTGKYLHAIARVAERLVFILNVDELLTGGESQGPTALAQSLSPAI